MRKHNVLTRLGGRRREPGSAQRAMRLTLVGLLVLPQSVAAAEIEVSGGCTLVDAITADNTNTATGSCSAGSGADTITLTADVTLTVVDSSTHGDRGLPVISTDVTIDGGGFTIARDEMKPAFGIFAVSPSGTLSLDNTTVSGGDVPFGGGIINFGTLTLTNSTVSGNYSGFGGGIFNSSGPTKTTLTNSTVSGDDASIYGGGINNRGLRGNLWANADGEIV